MIVPLSSVRPEALGFGTQQQDKSQLSRISTDSAAGASAAATGKTGRSGWSQMLAAEKAKAAELGLRINRPRQVTALPTKYHKALAWTGRIGWVGKAVVYAMIGGLACQSAVGNDKPDPHLPQTEQVAASPQVGVSQGVGWCEVLLDGLPWCHVLFISYHNYSVTPEAMLAVTW